MIDPEDSLPNPSLPALTKPRIQLSQIILIAFLLILVAVSALPGYISGQWRWNSPPAVTALKNLKDLRKTGLTLPGWTMANKHSLSIGGHSWLYQELKQGQQEVWVFLFPQNGPIDQPRVEWVDINGFAQQLWQDWKTDSQQTRPLTIDNQPVEVRYLRGWNPQTTYAIVQWYAWDQGGSPSPVSWFMADRLAQGQGKRAPWVAVCLMIPIEPLGEIDESWSLAQSLTEGVHQSLLKQTLVGASSKTP